MKPWAVISVRKVRQRWRLAVVATIVLIYGPWAIFGVRAGGGTDAPRSEVWTRERAVALTVNVNQWAPWVSEAGRLLVSSRVPATWFVVGHVVTRHPAWFRALAGQGMAIENHTNAHINLGWHSLGQDVLDLRQANDQIARAVGRSPRFLRPPYQAHSVRVLQAAAKAGLTPIWWSPGAHIVLTPDGVEGIHRLLRALHPGAIIWLSLSSPDSADDALPTVLRVLKAQGYHLWTLGHLIDEGRLVTVWPPATARSVYGFMKRKW